VNNQAILRDLVSEVLRAVLLKKCLQGCWVWRRVNRHKCFESTTFLRNVGNIYLSTYGNL